jgi:hypothetical protein
MYGRDHLVILNAASVFNYFSFYIGALDIDRYNTFRKRETHSQSVLLNTFQPFFGIRKPNIPHLETMYGVVGKGSN